MSYCQRVSVVVSSVREVRLPIRNTHDADTAILHAGAPLIFPPVVYPVDHLQNGHRVFQSHRLLRLPLSAFVQGPTWTAPKAN